MARTMASSTRTYSFAVGATGVLGLCWGMALVVDQVTARLGTPGMFFVLIGAVAGVLHGAEDKSVSTNKQSPNGKRRKSWNQDNTTDGAVAKLFLEDKENQRKHERVREERHASLKMIEIAPVMGCGGGEQVSAGPGSHRARDGGVGAEEGSA